jgi:hypothetical protein
MKFPKFPVSDPYTQAWKLLEVPGSARQSGTSAPHTYKVSTYPVYVEETGNFGIYSRFVQGVVRLPSFQAGNPWKLYPSRPGGPGAFYPSRP